MQLRELTCDPKFRRVLITDGRNATGQAMARAMAGAGASVMFVGIADPWKPFPGEAALRDIAGVEVVPLDITDSQSVTDVAGEIAHRVDILVNTAEHPRIGGIMHPARPDRRARGNGHPLFRHAAPGAAFRPDDAGAGRRRRQRGGRVRQSALGPCL